MQPLTHEQFVALGRVHAEMVRHLRPCKITIMGHDTQSGVTVDLGVMMPCDGFDALDDDLERWASTVPGYEVDDIGHGMQPVDGLIWREFHLIPTARVEQGT